MESPLLLFTNWYITAGLALGGFLTWYYWRHRGIPPGPHGLPFLGYAPFFTSHPQDKFLSLKKKYGDIFSLYMGPNLTIVLNDYAAMKAVFIDQGDIFLARPSSFIFDYISGSKSGRVHGLGSYEGENWRNTKRFTLRTFRDLGMGKSALQDHILGEAALVNEIFLKNTGKPFNPSVELHTAASNVIFSLCFGKRFEHDDPKFRYIQDNLNAFSLLLGQASILQAYPSFRFIPGPVAATWKRFVTIFERIEVFLKEHINDLKEKFSHDEDLKSRSFVGYFVDQQEKIKRDGREVLADTIFSEMDLLTNIQGFFGAGTETTAVTLLWAMLFMLHHPEIQEKVHNEIDAKVGSDRMVTVDDRAKLPYVEAVIREAQRLGNVVPLGILRANTEETILLGYRIPKRSIIMPNFSSVNMDPKLWPHPTEFRPERFINAEGQLEEPPYFMPFALGKRACVGESLAKMEVFLFFANIMHKFQLKPAVGYYLPPTDKYITGISCRPLPFFLDVQPRMPL